MSLRRHAPNHPFPPFPWFRRLNLFPDWCDSSSSGRDCAAWSPVARDASRRSRILRARAFAWGLALAKHARRVSELFHAVTVSLDGTNRETYAAIRGLDAFDKVCAGIQAAATTGVPVSVRVTVQQTNYRQLPALVEL